MFNTFSRRQLMNLVGSLFAGVVAKSVVPRASEAQLAPSAPDSPGYDYERAKAIQAQTARKLAELRTQSEQWRLKREKARLNTPLEAKLGALEAKMAEVQAKHIQIQKIVNELS